MSIDLPADKLLDEIVEEVQDFTKSGSFEDDACLVGIEVIRIQAPNGKLWCEELTNLPG